MKAIGKPGKIILAVISAFLLFLIFQVWTLLNALLDIRATMSDGTKNHFANGLPCIVPAGGWPPGTPFRPVLPMIEALEPPGFADSEFSCPAASVHERSSRFLGGVSLVKIRERLKKLPPEKLEKAVREFPGKIAGHLSSFPVCQPNPPFMTYGARKTDYDRIERTARFWYALSRHLAADGRGEDSFVCMLGVAFIANHLEADQPDGLPFSTKLTAISIRNMAAGGFLEIAPLIRPSREMTLKLFDKLARLENTIASLAHVFEFERSLIPSVGQAFLNGETKNLTRGGRYLSSLGKAAANKALVDPFLKEFWDPAIQACSHPYGEASKRLDELGEKLGKIQAAALGMNGFSVFNSNGVRYLLQPEKYLLEMMIALGTGNPSRCLSLDVGAKVRMRGAMIGFAIYAFKNVRGSWPGSLADLATWLGLELPLDLFTDRPFLFEPGDPPKLSSPGEYQDIERSGLDFLPIPSPDPDEAGS